MYIVAGGERYAYITLDRQKLVYLTILIGIFGNGEFSYKIYIGC